IAWKPLILLGLRVATAARRAGLAGCLLHLGVRACACARPVPRRRARARKAHESSPREAGTQSRKETCMDLPKRTLIRALVLAALALGLLAAVPAMAATTVYLEGVVTGGPDPDCVLVRDRQGNSFLLQGSGWYGVIGNDYVRLQGTVVPADRCG